MKHANDGVVDVALCIAQPCAKQTLLPVVLGLIRADNKDQRLRRRKRLAKECMVPAPDTAEHHRHQPGLADLRKCDDKCGGGRHQHALPQPSGLGELELPAAGHRLGCTGQLSAGIPQVLLQLLIVEIGSKITSGILQVDHPIF